MKEIEVIRQKLPVAVNDLSALMALLDLVVVAGHLYFIKGDAGRKPDQKYTVMITALDNSFEPIRKDTDDLGAGILFCLKRFVSVMEKR